MQQKKWAKFNTFLNTYTEYCVDKWVIAAITHSNPVTNKKQGLDHSGPAKQEINSRIFNLEDTEI